MISTDLAASIIKHSADQHADLLGKIKQARDKIEDITEIVHDGQNHYYKDCAETKKEVLAILDKLIEGEDK